ncbi:MAG: phosphoglucosamine mutase [Clostridia bacterium]|nr:phosphoglucosamine mutase [Clostridia bacterium]
MGVYFGTDGYRGIYGQTLSPDITYKIGNSLARLCVGNRKVLIGRDTRASGSLLTLSLASGLLSYGVSVVDIGIAPTPAVAYITKKLGFDYGVVISASHNPKNYNGIKVFDKHGFKISEQEEDEIERNLLYVQETINDHLGKYRYSPKLKKLYKESLSSAAGDLGGLKIALDLANGASYQIAKELFKKKGAQIVVRHDGCNGKKINVECGALYPEVIAALTVENGCDMGFAFDGDADRIIACDEYGKVLDGDDILYLLSRKTATKNVVGTSMTNKGLELALQATGQKLLRADVGDKYVSEMMRKHDASLGGEPSGHIINHNLSTTGDGVLTALCIASIVKEEKRPLSQLASLQKLPQINKNVEVIDKYRLLNSDILSAKIIQVSKEIDENGRLLVRASGTESKLRVMCEHISIEKALQYVDEIATLITQLNKKD